MSSIHVLLYFTFGTLASLVISRAIHETAIAEKHEQWMADYGCCRAFSAVAAIEGIVKIKTDELISLSEQQLVDCSTNGGNQGCYGGWMISAFDYITQNQGITTEESYPYEAMQETCDLEKQMTKAATISDYQMVPKNDEEALLKAVANQPVSVSRDGSGQNSKFYNGGVFTGECSSRLTHAVTIVGYGTDEEGL
ncbi:Vignain [Hibiscus syriacus]|uniref:Vignain n=1 Tax=Hibiscus syriacus TaxID=106335 RepID=A0A6A2ZJV1_HIBSY|nr:Vignain [Hibiscus syriacus]